MATVSQTKTPINNLSGKQSIDNVAMTNEEIYQNILREYPDILDVSQVSAVLGVSAKTLYRLLHEGYLASLKVGRSFKIPKLYVLQYIKVLGATEKYLH